MIVLSRPKKHGVMLKCNQEIYINQQMLYKMILLEKPNNDSLPKNTLKVFKGLVKAGYDGDDFVKNMKSIFIEYKVITFKRTNKKKPHISMRPLNLSFYDKA